MTRVILDTDIGTDVDDALALSLILCSPELQLEGVTCVYGDVPLRARIALKLLRLFGRNDVPVMMGAGTTLLRLREAFMAGHEGEGLLEPEDEGLVPAMESAADFIVRTVMDNPGEIHLVTVGPLTNAAQAFLREPRLGENLAHLTIMGGVMRGPDNLGAPIAEHNIESDPEASHVVLSSGAPITLVPIDVTGRVFIHEAGNERIRARGTPFHTAIAEQVERYPTFQKLGRTYLNDPLAVAIVIQPDFVKTLPVHVDVELKGQYTTGATVVRTPQDDAPANAQIAVDVDVARFEEFMVERLANCVMPG